MPNEIELQINTLIDALRTREIEEKKRYDSAIDIENMAEATEVTIDARTKIQQIRKWAENLVSLQKEIASSFISAEGMPTCDDGSVIQGQNKTASSMTDEADSEQIKVGYYIRSKLRELSSLGYQPTNEEITQWHDKGWSKRILNLNYPFAKLFSNTSSLNVQVASHNGRNRYWAEIFEFGTNKLLFCSQWYRQDRAYFDIWYNSLKTNEVSPEIQLPPIDLSEEDQIDAQLPKASEKAIAVDFSDLSTEFPTEFTLFGKTYSPISWDDVLIKLCEAIILKNPYNVLIIGVKKSIQMGGHPVLWLDERSESDQAYKLSNGLSVIKNRTGGEILPCCECILDFIKQKKNPEIIDQYFTTVGYFNALKDLGASSTIIQDRIFTHIRNLVARTFKTEAELYGIAPSDVKVFEHSELTSRKSSKEIKDTLEQLTIPYTDSACFSYVLASNMLSVGIDIDRLGVMTVYNQPKSNAEYIQATSRVGRKNPGLVLALYNNMRSRDKSHYEQFGFYHKSFYRYVEATSVTPFSIRAIEKALHCVFVALIRMAIPTLTPNDSARYFRTNDPLVIEVKDYLIKRVSEIMPSSVNFAKETLDKFSSDWEDAAAENGSTLCYKSYSGYPSLLSSAEEDSELGLPKILNSLRNVDPTVNIYFSRR